ncbi:MAG TPA: ABC transporter permease [Ktedonobacteraceae bacterium]|nr:ABC transporter permease [Ktedonobacteraceae bacterium]
MRTALLAIFNETYKRLLIMWDYKFNVLIQLVTIGLIFIGATYFIGGGQFNPSQVTSIFLGYIVWFYARIVIMNTSADLINEAEGGTLEQMYMTPTRTELLVLGRMLATLISTTIMVLLTALALIFILGIHFPLRWDGLLILVLTLAGLLGFTLILGGAALVFKQVDALADLMQNALLFLTGSLLPVSHFPNWLADIAKTLPITQGIIVLRNIELNGQSLATTWANGSLLWLIVHSAIYLSAGWIIFKWCERIAKRQGSLSQY